MKRRDFCFLLPALAATRAPGQTPTLPSGLFRYEDLPVRTSGANRMRPVFNGELRSGFSIEMHETELALGAAPHPPHHHPHEEVLVVREGTLEVTVAGKTASLGPGSVSFIAADDEHGWRNVGDTRARYYIFALGPDKAHRDSAAAPR